MSDDGLCGVPMLHRLRDGTWVRCRYEFGHGGRHSWAKLVRRYLVRGGVPHGGFAERAMDGRPSALQILP